MKLRRAELALCLPVHLFDTLVIMDGWGFVTPRRAGTNWLRATTARLSAAWASTVRAFFLRPFEDVMACLGHIMARAGSPVVLIPMMVAMAASWFVYVPIHELLHALGCVVAGGTISTLEISPRYGGAILERYFDFVVAGGEYAGRLSGFDTHGSDLIYLATDFGPYVLSVLVGVPLLRICARRRRPWLFGTAVVVGLAPFYNIPGDYFEMGSITLTRAVTILQGGGSSLAFAGIRSDDVFTLVANILTQAAAMGGAGGLGACLVLLMLVTLSLAVDILLAFLTYSAGAVVATALLPAVVASSRRRKPPGD